MPNLHIVGVLRDVEQEFSAVPDASDSLVSSSQLVPYGVVVAEARFDEAVAFLDRVPVARLR